MFAAKAGASKVYGIDLSDMADYAKDIVLENNYENITIIKDRVEYVNLPEKVFILFCNCFIFIKFC